MREIAIVGILTIISDAGRPAMLFMKRSPHQKLFPQKWNMPAGHVKQGEEPDDAAIRELKEETSVAVNKSDLHRVADFDFPIGSDAKLYSIRIYYVSKLDTTLDDIALSSSHTDKAVLDFGSLIKKINGSHAESLPQFETIILNCTPVDLFVLQTFHKKLPVP